jgi:hypothetical protein
MTMNEVHQDRELSTEVDWLGSRLLPLREGKVVILSLILAKKESRIRRVVEQRDKIVTIMPGQLVGLPRRTVIVSIIDNGSCIVEIDCNAIIGLVRAGVPAKLARALLEKLQYILKEEETHGDSTTTRSTRKKRPSSGAAGWKGRAPSVSTVPRSAYRESGKH